MESKSNEALFIQAKHSLVNCYAVKLNISKGHNSDGWLDKLKQYIYYRTKYVEKFDVAHADEKIAENDLKLFKEKNPELNWMVEDVILNNTTKKKDFFTWEPVLVHVLLHPNMKPVSPGTWENLIVESMKPVYYCPAFGTVASTPISEFPSCNCFIVI